MFYSELFADSSVNVNLASEDFKGSEFFAAAELDAEVNESNMGTFAALDAVDTMMDGLSGDEQKGASKIALALMDGFTGGASTDHFGISMENLSGDHYTEAQMGIKSMASNAWSAVIKFIKDMIRRVKVFLATFFDKMPGLKKRAEKIKERAEKTSGTAENSKISIGGYEVLAKKDKTVTGIAASIDVITKLPETAKLSEIPAAIPSDKLDKLSGDVATIQAVTFDAEVNKLRSLAGLPALNVDTRKVSGLDEGGHVLDLPGNKVFVRGYKGPTGNQLEQLRWLGSLRARFYTQESKVKFDKSTEVKTLETSEVEKICDAVIKFAETFEKSKSAVQAGYKEQEKLLKVAEKCEKNAGKSDYKDVKNVLNAGKAAIQNMATFAVNPTQQVAAYGYGVCSAALSYAEKSLSQYKD